MPSDPDYVYEKLADAVRTLATHPGPLSERLVFALACFVTIGPSSFPGDLGRDFKDLLERARGDEDAYEPALAKMRDEELSELASKILRLAYKMRDRLMADRQREP